MQKNKHTLGLYDFQARSEKYTVNPNLLFQLKNCVNAALKLYAKRTKTIS